MVIHLVFGICLLAWFRFEITLGQVLPHHYWDLTKMVLAGFFYDLGFWLFFGFIVQLRFLAWPALVLALVFTGLNMGNLAVSSHFKAGIVNFRFIIDYFSELGPLTRTGGSLMSWYSFIMFLFVPLGYWLWFFRNRRVINWLHSKGRQSLLSFWPIHSLQKNVGLLLLSAMLFIGWAEILCADRTNIVATNVIYRMLYNEYQAYSEMKTYGQFAESLQAGESEFPDRAHFERAGYIFNDPVFPLHKKPPRIKTKPSRRPNIVIIMMESVAAKDTGLGRYTGVYGKNVTPFLNSLLPRALAVKRFFSNADYTAGAEVAAFCSMHDSLRYTTGSGSILRSHTYTNLLCLPEILTSVGYQTLFFHPYTATFDRKNIFFPLNGVQEIIDKDHSAFKGLKQTFWGIQDKEMFRYGAGVLSRRKQPFMAIFLTVSNHPPYILHDEKDRRDFKEEGKYENYLNTVFQTDQAIKLFFEKSKNEAWFRNTVFIITSDNGVIIHPEKIKPVPWHQEFAMWHMVPFIMYAPGQSLGLKGRLLDLPAASHVDITPTVLDLLDIRIAEPFAGQSIFSKNRRGYTFVYDWFSNYYRLSWPHIYHASDRKHLNLVSGDEVPDERIDEYHAWVEKKRNFFNLLIFRNRVWLK